MRTTLLIRKVNGFGFDRVSLASPAITKQRLGVRRLAVFDFTGTVWHDRNPNTVYFVSLPEDLSAEILALAGTSLNPWGTVPVDAIIDDVTWYTSMFPRDKGRYYDLPLKLKIMNQLGLVDDQPVDVRIAIRMP